MYIILTMTYNLAPKSAKKFYCEKCDFICYKQSNWTHHTSTRKHKMETYGSFGNAEETTKIPKSFMCSCGKKFISKSGFCGILSINNSSPNK